jgi:hypothetical protein
MASGVPMSRGTTSSHVTSCADIRLDVGPGTEKGAIAVTVAIAVVMGAMAVILQRLPSLLQFQKEKHPGAGVF